MWEVHIQDCSKVLHQWRFSFPCRWNEETEWCQDYSRLNRVDIGGLNFFPACYCKWICGCCAPVCNRDIARRVDREQRSTWVASQITGPYLLYLFLLGQLKFVVHINSSRNHGKLMYKITSEFTSNNAAMLFCFQWFRKCMKAEGLQFEDTLLV